MTAPYVNPPSNLRSLQDRLVQAAQREGIVFGRLQRHVAVLVVTQLAAALVDQQGAPMLLVKGGSWVELRCGIADSRTSKDLDTVAREDIEVVHDRLADAGELGWEGFIAIFTPPVEIEIPAYRSSRAGSPRSSAIAANRSHQCRLKSPLSKPLLRAPVRNLSGETSRTGDVIGRW